MVDASITAESAQGGGRSGKEIAAGIYAVSFHTSKKQAKPNSLTYCLLEHETGFKNLAHRAPFPSSFRPSVLFLASFCFAFLEAVSVPARIRLRASSLMDRNLP